MILVDSLFESSNIFIWWIQFNDEEDGDVVDVEHRDRGDNSNKYKRK